MLCQHEIDALMAQLLTPERERLDDLPTGTEQREHPRWKLFDQYATLYCRGGEYWVAIRDVSLSGLRIAVAPDVLSVGTKALIVLVFDAHGTLAVTCQVVRLFEKNGVRYAGLRFTPQYPEELAPLTAYLNATESAG